jgi:short-subunit dehydrogenase
MLLAGGATQQHPRTHSLLTILENRMNETKLKDKWALVTGASSGFGADFARELASLGCNLILTARREDRLERVAAEIGERYGVSAKTIPMDLSKPEAPQELYDRIKAKGVLVDVLINNAGFGISGEFSQVEWSREWGMLQLNIMALTHLTKLFVRDMLARDLGYILNVASYAAYQPTPLFATYSASKSFVLNFSEALNYELRHTNVHCTAVSPGSVLTGFQQVAGQSDMHPTIRMINMESADVVRIGIKAMIKGRPSIVPGWKVKLIAWASQRAPRRWATAISGWLMSL